MHPKFDLTGVRTHGLQIMTVHFHVIETPEVTDGRVVRAGVAVT